MGKGHCTSHFKNTTGPKEQNSYPIPMPCSPSHALNCQTITKSVKQRGLSYFKVWYFFGGGVLESELKVSQVALPLESQPQSVLLYFWDRVLLYTQVGLNQDPHLCFLCSWDDRHVPPTFIDWDRISWTFPWAGIKSWSFRSLPPN
jgi:hypothetical protein